MSIKILKYKIYNIWFGEKKTLTDLMGLYVQFQVSLYAKILFEIKRVFVYNSTIFKLMDLCIFTFSFKMYMPTKNHLRKKAIK